MTASSDPVRVVVDRLTQAGLIPPVKDVEQRGGGVIHIAVSGQISDDLRTRVAEALASLPSTRWALHEGAAATDYR